MVDMVGAGGESRLQQAFIALLPTADKAVSLERAVQSASALQVGDLFKFCSPSAQGSIKAAADMISNMLQGYKPSFSMATPFFSQVKVQLQFFCRHLQPASADEPATELVGSEALQHKLASVTEQDPSELAVSDLEPFHVFSWLLSASEVEQIADLTTKVMAMVDKKFDKASAKKAAAKSTGAAQKKCQPGDDVQAALALFA
jgi:hypothetical protein